jgi:sterol desaturase/sphingolipid hydroxylase (fatty acid hydroxylase superfamily)
MNDGATTRDAPGGGRRAASLVRAAFWPAVAAWTVGVAVLALRAGLAPEIAQGVVLLLVWAACSVTERIAPASQAWTATAGARPRDATFGAITLAIDVTAALAIGAVSLGALLPAMRAGDGPLAALHPAAATLVLLVVYDLIQYGIHRGCHELRGPAGRFLWRVHSVHHRPEALNARMSLVTHPLETIVVRAVALGAPILLLAPDPAAAYWLVVIVNMQTVLVHWNADVALGPLRHVVAGPAIHRIHHGAGRDDGRNYAAVFTPLDRIFGTWHEKGGAPPDRIGIRNDRRYPAPTDVAALLRWPFAARRRAVSSRMPERPRT